ncbi:MAG: helix-turn-helix domain-containing protein, partial [Candidatus Acidiferrales bacterium]
MRTGEQLIKARLEVLGLAVELQNIALACRRAGISRSHFYEIKDAFDRWGAEGLAPRPRQKPRMPNQTSPELEARILEMTERHPTLSYLKISHELTIRGVGALPSAVRYVWQRHGLTVRHQRLHWVERRRAERGGMLTEPQMELPRPCEGSQTDLKQQAEAPRPATMPANTKTTQALR